MILHPPLIITPRLMAGVRIGHDGWISLGTGPRNSEGRTVYECWIDYADQEHEVTDLRSGCQGGDVREGLATLLALLGAAVESRQYRKRQRREYDPDADSAKGLFPPAVVRWASAHADEISMLQIEIEEGTS